MSPGRSHPASLYVKSMISALTLTQVMVGRGSPWAAQVMATSWPVSATTSWGGWRNTGITVQQGGEKVTSARNVSRKIEKSACKTSQNGQTRAAGAPSAAVSALQRGQLTLCNLYSLFSAPVGLYLGQLHRNMPGSVSFKVINSKVF